MPTLPVLVYHMIGDAPPAAAFPGNYVPACQFEAQLRFLRRAGFQSVSIPEYLEYRRGRGGLPARPIVITFDDGYRRALDVAAPHLARLGFRATVFVVTGLIGRTNLWDGCECQEPLLSVEEITAWQRSGIEFQSHTVTHRRLSELSDADVFCELVESRRTLEDLLGMHVSVIAYPWGERTDVTLRLAREAGYEAGVIVRRRTNFDHTPLFELRRIGINSATSLPRFAWDLARLRWRGD